MSKIPYNDAADRAVIEIELCVSDDGPAINLRLECAKLACQVVAAPLANGNGGEERQDAVELAKRLFLFVTQGTAA